jgi:hypothetical protein
MGFSINCLSLNAKIAWANILSLKNSPLRWLAKLCNFKIGSRVEVKILKVMAFLRIKP